jgi:hypothetical protein
MLVLLAAAVESIADDRFDDITCAWSDAKRVYDTFDRVCGDLFDRNRSAVLRNAAAGDFVGLISSVALSLEPNDQLVIYFSGHAVQLEGSTVLLFVDAGLKGRGRARIEVLAAPLVDTSVETIFLLDCCYSGNALSVASSPDPLIKRRVSVLASCDAFDRSQHSGAGSAFTLSLCRAFSHLAEEEKPLSLTAVCQYIQADEAFIGEPQIRVLDGKPDHIIRCDRPNWHSPEDAAKRFVDALLHADLRLREALWYGVREMPSPEQAKIVARVIDSNTPSEPSWIVRRAMGIVIGNLAEDSPLRMSIITDLLQSDADWMRQAVGIIAARNDLRSSDELWGFVRRAILREDNADMVWLAHLYGSDARPSEALEAALKSRLIETTWGVVDIFRRHEKKGAAVSEGQLVNRIVESCSDKVARGLGTYLHVSGHTEIDGLPAPDRDIADSEFVHKLNTLHRRGKVRHPQSEWLFSYLYGAWRDELEGDIFGSIAALARHEWEDNISLAMRSPLLEVRMALCRGAATLKGVHNGVDVPVEVVTMIQSLGVEDDHPWVRREALTKSAKDCSSAFSVSTQRGLYPGVLDLAVVGEELGVLPNIHSKLRLTKLEETSLKSYCRTPSR